MVAARLSDQKLGVNQYTTEGMPIGRAAKVFDVSPRSVARTKVVLRDGVPELVEAVASGQVAISEAEKISKLPKSKQRRALASRAGPRRRRSAKPKTAKSKAPSKSDSVSTLGDECLALLTPLDPRKPKAYFAGLKSVWDKSGLAAAWKDAPRAVRERFKEEVLH
jgi:hypothetical protein